jgi:hypothetical protein
MSFALARKVLNKVGLLETARSVKRRWFPADLSFRPCTPHLLIAVNKALRWCAEQGIAEGSDYLEFGIFRGFTLWYAQAIAREMPVRDLRFYGFDGFAGLPPPGGIDKNGDFNEGQYGCSRKEVEGYLSTYGVDWAKTFLVEGWFEQSLTGETRRRLGLRKCSLCVIDCDLCESARLALDFVAPLVQDRSVVLFDDWTSFGNDPNRGEQRAFAEFLAANRHVRAEPFASFGGHGQGFVLRVAADAPVNGPGARAVASLGRSAGL